MTALYGFIALTLGILNLIWWSFDSNPFLLNLISGCLATTAGWFALQVDSTIRRNRECSGCEE